MDRNLPGGLVIKNPLCDAGDLISIPGWGTKTQHDLEQLSPCAGTIVPVCHKEKFQVPRGKIPHDAAKILQTVVTKSQSSQTNK